MDRPGRARGAALRRLPGRKRAGHQHRARRSTARSFRPNGSLERSSHREPRAAHPARGSPFWVNLGSSLEWGTPPRRPRLTVPLWLCGPAFPRGSKRSCDDPRQRGFELGEMSAVPTEFRGAEPGPAPEQSQPTLSRGAKLYLVAVGIATVVAVFVPLSHLSPQTSGWPTFFVIASCAAIAQLFVVRTPRDQSYHTSIVFLIAAALLLPPELVALVGLVQHIPEWLKVRYPWYIQCFNICNYTLNGLAAWGAVWLVRDLGLATEPTMALAGLAACVVFVATNHVLLATMLHFARGHTLRET